jgi:endonuclease/exonuclease/phosphatase family metal-dependent hydrolase
VEPAGSAPAAVQPAQVAPAAVQPAASELAARPGPLRIASWNIQRLGHGDKDLALVAKVLAEFDLVAVQEVMTRDVVDQLAGAMKDHRVLLTDTPTPRQGSHREFFAFFYRPGRLEPVLNTFVADPEDRFLRDPYLACFTVATTAERLCLLTVHIVWGDTVGQRKAEILALDDALRWAQEGDETSSWVVLGDFNRVVDDRDRDSDPEEEWTELLDRRQLREPVVLAGKERPTTLGRDGYANAYDHIFVSLDLAGRVTHEGRYDIVASCCDGDFGRCRKTLSDHAPVFIEVAPPP